QAGRNASERWASPETRRCGSRSGCYTEKAAVSGVTPPLVKNCTLRHSRGSNDGRHSGSSAGTQTSARGQRAAARRSRCPQTLVFVQGPLSPHGPLETQWFLRDYDGGFLDRGQRGVFSDPQDDSLTVQFLTNGGVTPTSGRPGPHGPGLPRPPAPGDGDVR